MDTHQKYDQFESIPKMGDVKVHTERIGPVIHMFVDTASRVEVSARDIRSRIAAQAAAKTKPNSDDAHNAPTSNSNPIPDSISAVESDTSNKKSSIQAETEKPKVEIIPSRSKVLVSEKTTVLYCTVFCSQITFVLQDDIDIRKETREILRVTADNVVVSARPKLDMSERLRALYYRVREQVELRFFIGDLQIDNQLYVQGNYDFPVVMLFQDRAPLTKFSPLTPMERIAQIAHNEAKFVLMLFLEKSVHHGNYLQSVVVKLQPVRLYAEDVFFYSLLDIAQSFLSYGKIASASGGLSEKAMTAVVTEDILSRSLSLTYPVNILNLDIQEIRVQLSVHASVKIYIALDQTPLEFGAYQRSGVVTTNYILGHNMAKHYLSGALVRAGWVVGSLEIIGNPGGFARTVGSGVKDFVQLPYEGIMLGPWAFISGVTHGSLSLVKHFTAGMHLFR